MREHFDFYGYNSPTSGEFYADGEVYSLGKDYRTVKRYLEYKNVGFNILLLQHGNSYSGEDFNKSACKKCMDKGFRAGLDRTIVSDTRLKDLCEEKILVGSGGKFKTEKELLDYIDFCTKPYRDHPGFYGVQLFDEPPFQMLKTYAEVYLAIKKVLPDCEIQCNLLNLCAPSRLSDNPSDPVKDYENYLTYFIEHTGINYILTDEYAFRRNNVISDYTIPLYQILAKVCKKYHIELRLIMQSFSQQGCALYDGVIDGGISWRRVTEMDMYWQMNLAMGFGCKEFSFFTYFTKPFLKFKGKSCVTDGVDGAAFINYDGTRTKLYYYTRRIISEMKKFESVMLKYDYENSWFFFENGKTYKDFSFTEKVTQNSDCPVHVEIDRGVAIVCALKDKQDNKMFMVENIRNTVDRFLKKERKSTVKIDISNMSDNYTVYYRGEKVNTPENKKIIELKIECGDALFFEIRK